MSRTSTSSALRCSQSYLKRLGAAVGGVLAIGRGELVLAAGELANRQAREGDGLARLRESSRLSGGGEPRRVIVAERGDEARRFCEVRVRAGVNVNEAEGFI